MVDTAKVISDHSSGDVVGLFDKVVIYIPDDDEEQTIRLVTTLRQNALEGLISKESPVGKAVMGHRAGETVHVQVNENVGYDIVIRSVEKGQDDDSLPISATYRNLPKSSARPICRDAAAAFVFSQIAEQPAPVTVSRTLAASPSTASESTSRSVRVSSCSENRMSGSPVGSRLSTFLICSG